MPGTLRCAWRRWNLPASWPAGRTQRQHWQAAARPRLHVLRCCRRWRGDPARQLRPCDSLRWRRWARCCASG